MKSPLQADKTYETDFPNERVESEHVSRREFAKFLCLVSCGLTVGSGWVAVKDKLFPPFSFKGDYFVCKVDDVPIGGTHPFQIEDSKIPFILIRLKDGSFRAYEQKCTHLACAVYYQPNIDQIVCPCHSGYFSAQDGSVLQGPPPRRLPHLNVVIKGDDVYVNEPKHDKEEIT
ncbi:MAG: Rieske (2Fe-2S) protein [Chthoniobacterales bacterium]